MQIDKIMANHVFVVVVFTVIEIVERTLKSSNRNNNGTHPEFSLFRPNNLANGIKNSKDLLSLLLLLAFDTNANLGNKC